MNYITIAGHLGADPETRFTSSGQKVTTLRVACNSKRSGKEETIWWKVSVWGEQFDKMLPYFKKGSSIIVMGEIMKPEIFNDREGKPQISLNITANNIQFSPFGKGEKREETVVRPSGSFINQGSNYSDGNEMTYGRAPEEAFNEEEIPF
jgi:single-strand DNA-binding protein